MRRLLLLLLLVAACGDNAPAPADAGTCASVGCPDFALCNATGTVCSCLTDAGPVRCVR